VGEVAHSRRSVTGARVAGVVACVPTRKVGNEEFVPVFGEEGVSEVTKVVGVKERRWAAPHQTTADLCCASAERLLADLAWDRKTISALIFVSQTPEFRLPATACELQHRLGIGSGCAAFDVNLGCSGYTYGLWLSMTLAAQQSGGRVLLLVGDTISKIVDFTDRATATVFGDAGSATAVEADPSAPEAFFVFGTDGGGSRRLIVADGAYRVAAALPESFGNRDRTRLFMDGPEIFNFTLKVVPSCVREVCDFSGVCSDEVDYFLLHQANAFMLRHLSKKMKLDSAKVPINIDQFGNVSSASIPLLIASTVRDGVLERDTQMLLAGFGVGFSWCAAVMRLSGVKVIELIES
jgi:3-oxoacyl-[acyl-carrier-protein] synthase-3